MIIFAPILTPMYHLNSLSLSNYLNYHILYSFYAFKVMLKAPELYLCDQHVITSSIIFQKSVSLM